MSLFHFWPLSVPAVSNSQYITWLRGEERREEETIPREYLYVFVHIIPLMLNMYLSLFGNKLDFHSAEHGINNRSIMQSTSIYMQIPEPFCLLTSFLKIQELRSFPSLFCFVFLSIHFGQNVIINVDLDFLVVIVYIFVILTYINIIIFFLNPQSWRFRIFNFKPLRMNLCWSIWSVFVNKYYSIIFLKK